MLTLTSCFLTLKMTYPVGVTTTSTPLTTVSNTQSPLLFILLFSFIEIEYLLILFSNRQRPLWKQCGEDRVLSVPKGHAIHIYFFRVIRRGVFCQWWQRQSTGVSSQVQIERDLYNNDCYPDNRIKFTPDYVPKRRKKQQRCDLYVNMLLYKTVVKPNWMLVQLLEWFIF